MPADPNNLIWIDMEMTGLQPDSDRIIEMALLVTDAQLNILAESPAWVLHQPDEVLEAMDSWNKGTHAKTGLIGRVKAASLTEAQAESMALEFLAPHVPANASPMCGNSICQDRRFLARNQITFEWLTPDDPDAAERWGGALPPDGDRPAVR